VVVVCKCVWVQVEFGKDGSLKASERISGLGEKGASPRGGERGKQQQGQRWTGFEAAARQPRRRRRRRRRGRTRAGRRPLIKRKRKPARTSEGAFKRLAQGTSRTGREDHPDHLVQSRTRSPSNQQTGGRRGTNRGYSLACVPSGARW